MSLKFGFGGAHVSHSVRNYDDVVFVIKYGEFLGYDFVQITDRVRDPYITATVAAKETTKMNIWIGVVNPFTRHPVVAANSLSLLDEIAPGRVGAILGTGNMTEMLPQLGYDYKGASERVREAIQIVRQCFGNLDLEFKGKHFNIKGEHLAFPAKHQVPIYVAANGPKMLEVGGELADGVITQYANKELMSKALEHIKIGAERAGRSLSEIDITWEGALVVKREGEELPETLLPHSTNCLLFCPPAWIESVGISKEEYARIKQNYVMGSHISMKAERDYIEKLKKDPIAQKSVDFFTIAGSPNECKRSISELERMGIKRIFFWVASNNSVGKLKILDDIAEHLIPAFR
jgi:5,10-methylenetetrahydromethanopterin reductase